MFWRDRAFTIGEKLRPIVERHALEHLRGRIALANGVGLFGIGDRLVEVARQQRRLTQEEIQHLFALILGPGSQLLLGLFQHLERLFRQVDQLIGQALGHPEERFCARL